MSRAFPGTVVEPRRPVPVRVGRLRTAVRSTPARLVVWLVSLLVVLLAYCAVALFGTLRTSGQVDAVRVTDGPLTVAAQSLYRSLSDADATAATAFLSGEPEPADLRQRYDDDIAAAGAWLARASTGTDASPASITTIATQLPVYAGKVETARADNRLGYPVGAAYLREASNLMRTVLLPAAAALYGVAVDRLAVDSRDAGQYPFAAVGLGLVALLLLLRAQRFLVRRTSRLVNPGAAIATFAVVTALAWQNASWFSLAGHLDSATRTGSTPVQTLVQARTAALQARTDEALTLVARGSGQGFETDFQTVMTRLIGSGDGGLLGAASARAGEPGVRGLIDDARVNVRAWRGLHSTLRRTDDGGDYPKAVAMATDTGPASLTGTFTRLDADLAAGIAQADTDFRTETDRAAGAVTGVAVAVGLLVLLALAATTVGVQRRIAEYR